MTTEYSDAGGTEQATISDNGALVDIDNSTSTPLLANEVYTGTWKDVSNYSHVMIQILPSHAGAGQMPLLVEFSHDKTNIVHTHPYEVEAGVGENVQVHVHAKYYRIVYSNGPTQQTSFSLEATLKPLSGNGSIIEVDDRISPYDDAVLGKSVLSGRTSNIITPTYTDVKVTESGSLQVSYDHDALDAFGRLRISNPLTLFEHQMRYSDSIYWDTALAGAGSTTYQINESTMDLNVSTASGDSVIRETKYVMHYQPGKSLLYLSTFVMAPSVVGLTQRVGYYGAQNGAYFEMVNGVANFVLRSYVTGSIVETRIPQSQWNVDKLDGTGDFYGNPSGILFDPTKAQIFFMDFEWLGVGRVHYGFILDGRYIICHQKTHANSNLTTYMTTACLPCRYEIFTTGVLAAPAKLKQICTTVISEGGYEPITTPYFAGNNVLTPKTLTTAGTYYPIVSIRLNSTKLDSIVVPTYFNGLFTGTGKVGHFKVILNPTLTGAVWTPHANGHVDYDITATGYTGGTELSGSFITSTGTGSNSIANSGININDFALQLGRKINGTADIITVVATVDTNGTPFYGQIGWREVI